MVLNQWMALRCTLQKLSALVAQLHAKLGTAIENLIVALKLFSIKAGLASARAALDVQSVFLEVSEIHAEFLRLLQEGVHLELCIGHIDVDEIVSNSLPSLLKLFNIVDSGAIDGGIGVITDNLVQ